MLSMILSLLPLVASPVASASAEPVDVTEPAQLHRAWSGRSVVVMPGAYERLVDWSDADSDRMDMDLDPEMRLDAVLAAGAQALREITFGAPSALFLVEYADREKRGNPRRARVRLDADPSDPGRVLIDLA